MRVHRIYHPNFTQADAIITILGEQAHYLHQVLRATVGQEICVFNGQGLEASIRLVSLDKKAVIGEIRSMSRPAVEAALSITLIQGLAKRDAMDWIVQKATELGAHHIVPVVTDRSTPKLQGARAEKRLNHWQKVSISACEQSGRTRLPTIEPVQPLAAAKHLAERSELILVPDPSAKSGWPPVDANPKSVAICIGPEGGWSDNELAQFKRLDSTHTVTQTVNLGPRVLRTETAALTTISLTQARWGDFRNQSNSSLIKG